LVCRYCSHTVRSPVAWLQREQKVLSASSRVFVSTTLCTRVDALVAQVIGAPMLAPH